MPCPLWRCTRMLRSLVIVLLPTFSQFPLPIIMMCNKWCLSWRSTWPKKVTLCCLRVHTSSIFFAIYLRDFAICKRAILFRNELPFQSIFKKDRLYQIILMNIKLRNVYQTYCAAYKVRGSRNYLKPFKIPKSALVPRGLRTQYSYSVLDRTSTDVVNNTLECNNKSISIVVYYTKHIIRAVSAIIILLFRSVANVFLRRVDLNEAISSTTNSLIKYSFSFYCCDMV